MIGAQSSCGPLQVPCGDGLERVVGIEPTRPAWKAGVLPLNYTRKSKPGKPCAPIGRPITASTIIAYRRAPCQGLPRNFFPFSRKKAAAVAGAAPARPSRDHPFGYAPFLYRLRIFSSGSPRTSYSHMASPASFSRALTLAISALVCRKNTAALP